MTDEATLTEAQFPYAGPQLLIDLIGPWQAYDAEDPIGTADVSDLGRQVLEQMRDFGLIAPVPQLPAGVELVLTASMVDPGTDPKNEPPLIASIGIIRSQLPVPQPPELTADGSIVPARRAWTTTVDWPEGLGDVTFLHIEYVIVSADGHWRFDVEFTTPNLPLREAVEAFVDVIVSTARFSE